MEAFFAVAQVVQSALALDVANSVFCPLALSDISSNFGTAYDPASRISNWRDGDGNVDVPPVL